MPRSPAERTATDTPSEVIRNDTNVALVGATQVSVGDAHGCAVTGSGELWCWGNGGKGQLGTGFTTSSSTARKIAVGVGETVTYVTAGGDHTCAVTATRKLFCWGGNLSGEVGNGASGAAAGEPLAPAGAP